MNREPGDRCRQPRPRFSAAIRLVTATLLVMSAALSSGIVVVLADTTAETGVSVVVVNGGSLDVHWERTDLVFALAGDSRGPTAAESATATTTLLLAVRDTRAEGARSGYDITLTASPFRTDDGEAQIGAELLMVSDITGLPTDEPASQVIGATLETPVTLLSVGCHEPAVDTVLAITVRVTMPAGTLPGAYAGSFFLDVLPATACGL